MNAITNEIENSENIPMTNNIPSSKKRKTGQYYQAFHQKIK